MLLNLNCCKTLPSTHLFKEFHLSNTSWYTTAITQGYHSNFPIPFPLSVPFLLYFLFWERSILLLSSIFSRIWKLILTGRYKCNCSHKSILFGAESWNFLICSTDLFYGKQREPTGFVLALAWLRGIALQVSDLRRFIISFHSAD